MSSEKPIVAVTGGTGGQGGSVIDALLESGHYRVRAVLRNLTPAKTKPLSDRGVEIVQGDLEDKASLVKAFRGANVIFAMTDFFEPFVKYGPQEAEKRELAQAKNLSEAAAETSGLSHYVWSTLPSSAILSKGKYHTPHFESKASVDEYILKQFPELTKTTFLWIAYYANNLTFPPFTPNLLKTSGKQPALTRGSYVLAEVETLTNGELLERWGKVTGNSTVYIPGTLEAYNELFPAWGLEMGVMLQFWEAVGDASWSRPGATLLRKQDLGIDTARFTGLDAAWAQIDWKKL
ncbi:uncharacterized protein N7473_012262 [Penicillium subrubescens]|uniref:uncharacterized protein n=1 Tax=Penicillium subrubescens TaxID=1316194 RepID=UPI0025459202|nr:uncharacterized protein N7473_012262 [Penicillium subrubescens]KAJ5881209.1 hypothetical protein N7473_012262 [Penicillium subrubescens]